MSGPAPVERVDDLEQSNVSEFRDLVPLGPPFSVDRVSLIQSGAAPPSLAQCGTAFHRICKINDWIRYGRGDLMNITEGLFAEEASQVIDHELLTEAEAKAEMFVSSRVSRTTRMHSPSWEHSRSVAALDQGAQLQWLDRARAEGWTARKLATEISQATSDGKTFMKWFLIVDTPTEAKRDKLAEQLQADGWTVSKKEAVKKVPKAKKRKPKKEITARARKAPEASTRRRKS